MTMIAPLVFYALAVFNGILACVAVNHNEWPRGIYFQLGWLGCMLMGRLSEWPHDD